MESKYKLGFISDTDIFEHVRNTVLLYRRSINLHEFNKNIIDPIKLTFDAKVYGKEVEEIIEAECIRQIDKSNTNHIGYFHQNLFEYTQNGWRVPKEGFDIVNDDLHIYVELKNKHNTMNAGAATSIYARMQNKILHDDQAICMLVEVIATRSMDEKWTNGGLSHKNIRRVSIDKFYELVFGDSYAFYKLCSALPKILDDVMASLSQDAIENSVYDELKALSPEIMRSLYRLAFKTYAGFESL